MYLDPFSAPAYELTGTVQTVFVGFEHFPDEDCVINVDCVQCVISSAKAQSYELIMTSVSLIKLCSLSAWPSILLLLTFSKSNVTACRANLDLLMSTPCSLFII